MRIWRRENPTTLQRDYEILPRVTGRGRYLGANLGVIVDGGGTAPALVGRGRGQDLSRRGSRRCRRCAGTGTEDYIGTGYGHGRVLAPTTRARRWPDHEKQRYAFYR